MKYQTLVDSFQKSEYKNEPVYFWAIEQLKEVRKDLHELSDTQHLLGIIKPFLIKWGRMGRVVSRKEVRWEIFGEKLRNLEIEFKVLRCKRFRNVNYDDITVSTAIKTIYGKLDPLLYLGGPTTISKVLH
ncbi:MAG: hypothetical protein ACXADB_08065, partial [Candidatus Hermodarchaeia archaeon]